MGITDTVIRCQGDIRARYLHNCTVELFGNLYVKNEIFDSQVTCSGKIESPTCRVISSQLGAKQAVVLAGVGSERTLPCRITVGSEAHLILQVGRILAEIERVRKAGARMDEKIEEVQKQTRKAFEKMVELKIFHDRAKKTKRMLALEYKNKGQFYTPEKTKQIQSLMANFDGRMERSIKKLKELNSVKKKTDQAHEALFEKELVSKIEHQVKGFEQSLYALLEWARPQPKNPVIEIREKSCQGTIFRGVWAEKTLMSDAENIRLREEETARGCQLRQV